MKVMLNGRYGSCTMTVYFKNIYHGKRILITGNTGFKGSWLTIMLKILGAKIVGYSSPDLPSTPCNFEICGLSSLIVNIGGDILDKNKLMGVISQYEPEIVFHLAAQPIVRRSYVYPQDTFFINMGGTVNILECIRRSKSVKAAVIITSDKCYQNDEWVWGYRENDSLGGNDPYSASKACAEIATKAYIKSFFSERDSPKIATARSGNVIGGGDWSEDRIIPDCVRSYSKGDKLEIRNTEATRSWMHVLDSLSGYLWLGANLLQSDNAIAGEAFNFGPSNDAHRTVEELIREFSITWKGGEWIVRDSNSDEKKESYFLKLNADKALHHLGWHTTLSFERSVAFTADWYKTFYAGHKKMFDYSVRQIEEYSNLSQKNGLRWAEG